MHDSSSTPNDRPALQLNVEARQAASSGYGIPSMRNRLLWSGLGFAGLVALIGLSAWASHPIPSGTALQPLSRTPSLSASAFATVSKRTLRLPLFAPVVDLRLAPGGPKNSARSMNPPSQRLVVPRMRPMFGTSLLSQKMSSEDKSGKQSWQNLKKDPLAQIKKYGPAGIVSYLLLKPIIYAGGAAGGLVAFYVSFGHWPVFSDPGDMKLLAAEAFAFVNLVILAIPLRIGVAIAISPWVNEKVIKRFSGNVFLKAIIEKFGVEEEIDWENFADDFKVVTERTGAAVPGGIAKTVFEFARRSPLNQGGNVEIEKQVSTSTIGEPTLLVKWKIEIEESAVQEDDIVEQIKQWDDFPLHIEGSSTFTLNQDGKVSAMSIGAWSANGKELSTPDVKDLTEADSAAVQKWAKEMVVHDSKDKSMMSQ